MLVEKTQKKGRRESSFTDEFIAEVKQRNPQEREFLQAVEEVVSSLALVMERHPDYQRARILQRVVEPERVVMFRVPWLDDFGEVHVNRGYRVQFNSALGPYKGGLRFHRSVNLSVLKFLGFEQIFKNALTCRPLGGGKGGSDFNAKGRTDTEVMRFCQSFMTGLFRHIGPDTDIPAGDIGVGQREIGFMFGQYKRIANEFSCPITGKAVNWGGSHLRPEATGYGLVYFAAAMLAARDESLEGRRCLISGSGNVAQYTCEKLLDLGAKPVTLSDSDGFIYDPDGITREKLQWVMDLKNDQRGRIREYADQFKEARYTAVDGSKETNRMWEVEAECAFPCATENEISEQDARHLVENGLQLIAEGANMPATPEASDVLEEARVLVGPGKATNAGGVAVSAMEMSQNAGRVRWSREKVDGMLRQIMQSIHDQAAEAAEKYGVPGNYVAGANIAGFLRVADAMMDQGVV